MTIITLSILFLSPVLFSVGNILDKRLVNKGINSSPLLIVVISALLSFVAMPSIYLLFGIDSNVRFVHAFIMVLSGIATILSAFLYLKALEKHSVLSIAPALQITTVVSYVLGIIFFNEFISLLSLVGCFLIVVCSFFLTIKIDQDTGDYKFNSDAFLMTFFSSTLLAISGTLFKFFAINYDYWTVQYYEYVGILFFGIYLVIAKPLLRSEVYKVFTSGKYKNFLSLNIAAEAVMVSGDLALNYSTLIVPIAIAFSFNSLQPVILLFLIAIVNKVFRFFNNRDYIEGVGLKEIFIIITIVVGVFLVYLGSGSV